MWFCVGSRIKTEGFLVAERLARKDLLVVPELGLELHSVMSARQAMDTCAEVKVEF